MGVTPYDELDTLLGELVARGRDILGDAWVGGYVQGSFALGAGDLTSDCDFLMVVRERPGDHAERRLRKMHDEIPTRAGFWCGHLEGSYAVADDLRTLAGLGREWLYVDHGWREMQWSTHCNNEWTRWLLRERGLTLDGPAPSSLVDPVPADALRARMREALPRLLGDLATWVDIEAIAWGQRYAVMTAARQLYTLATGEVTSKPDALRWAMSQLDPRWRSLLEATLADRSAFDPLTRPDPEVVAETVAFVDEAARLAKRGTSCVGWKRVLRPYDVLGFRAVSRYRDQEGQPDPDLVRTFGLEVDGEQFTVRVVRDPESGDTDTGYSWVSGPNEGYGFGIGGPPHPSMEEHQQRIRDFLAMVDPTTGYIEDD